MSALTWNLFHGRDYPPDPALFTLRSRLLGRSENNGEYAQVNRSLRAEFAALLAGLEWEVALLQEAPPSWAWPLAQACAADAVLGLTSRNSLAPLRRLAARLNPDLIASNEGGSNMVLVRSPGHVLEHERIRLARLPERRALLLCRVAPANGPRLAVACMHLSVGSTGKGAAELARAASLADEFAAGDPLILGGDLNLRPAEHPEAFSELEDRYGLSIPTGPRAIDHLLARDLEPEGAPRALPAAAREVPAPEGRLRLSDHAPVLARFRGLRR